MAGTKNDPPCNCTADRFITRMDRGRVASAKLKHTAACVSGAHGMVACAEVEKAINDSVLPYF